MQEVEAKEGNLDSIAYMEAPIQELENGFKNHARISMVQVWRKNFDGSSTMQK